MSETLVEAVRALRVADPDLGVKPLIAKLREQQPDLGTKEVREALKALKAESEATKSTAAAAPPSANVSGAPLPVALSLACFGCARLPSEMDDGREKHDVCPICVKLKVPTTYWCCVNCPGNPGAWKRHAVYHKGVKEYRKTIEDGGVVQQRARKTAKEQVRNAAQTGDKYDELLADGLGYESKQDWRRAGRAYREAIPLRPDEPPAYLNLGGVLCNSGHYVEAAQRFLQAQERWPVGSELWARATAAVFDMLQLDACAEVVKPEWWNDEALKALSARVVRAAPNDLQANQMRAKVLSGLVNGAWKAGPRSVAEYKKAATHYERVAADCTAPLAKAKYVEAAKTSRKLAELCALLPRGMPWPLP